MTRADHARTQVQRMCAEVEQLCLYIGSDPNKSPSQLVSAVTVQEACSPAWSVTRCWKRALTPQRLRCRHTDKHAAQPTSRGHRQDSDGTETRAH